MALAALVCTAAGPATCPSRITDADGTHLLNNASVFNSPPQEMADLVPDRLGSGDRWEVDRLDPYLVCRFARTSHVVTLHVRSATVCEERGDPLHVGCR